MKTRDTNILVVTGLLLVFGFFLTSVTSFFSARASLRSEITTSTLPLTSDNVYSEINRDLLKPIFVSFNMAHDTFLRDWVLNGEKNHDEIIRYLKEMKIKNGTVSSFFVSDLSGNYYYADGLLKKVSQNETRDAWFYRVKNMKEEYEINIDIDLANQDNMTIFINYRVLDYQDRFIGATGVGLTVNAVRSLIGTYQETYGSNIFFVDTEGSVKLHSDSFPEGITHLDQIDGLKEIKDEILASDHLLRSYPQRNGRMHVNTRYIPEFDWILIVEKSETEALQSIWKTLLLNIAICVAISLIIGFLITRLFVSYQRKMEDMAHTDKLTGALNRRAFPEIIPQLVEEAKINGQQTTIALIDIDHFKNVNDQFGHLKGDEVLQRITEIIRGKIRKTDLLFRWGGDEFILVFRYCNLAQATANIEEIRKSIYEKKLIIDNPDFRVSISSGLHAYVPDEDFDQWINRCDELLYRAKEQGRNLTMTDDTEKK